MTEEGLPPLPPAGRRFQVERRVRLGDVTPRGRLRLDALARYLQDVSNDDVMAAELEGAMAWVVRRTRVEVEQFPVFREDIGLTTWCSGIGSRWASRRIQLVGVRGGRVEAEALWVHVDLESGRPKRLPEEFEKLYGESAGGRVIRARLHHPPPPDDAARSTGWQVRFADLDLMGHVNNAVYWSMLEERLAVRRDVRAPMFAEVEHPGPVDPGSTVEFATADDADRLGLWVIADGIVAATALAGPMP